MLLNYVGEEVFDIYENILPPGEHSHSYKDVTEALDKHFAPKVNHSYETYIFRSMKQFIDESVQQFYIRLKAQGAKCNFTDILFSVFFEMSFALTLHMRNGTMLK